MSAEGEARSIMGRAHFSTVKIRTAVIWAAKWRACPKCGAEIGKPCENLNDRIRDKLSYTVWPHDPRIDWEMLLGNLHAKGHH